MAYIIKYTKNASYWIASAGAVIGKTCMHRYEYTIGV